MTFFRLLLLCFAMVPALPAQGQLLAKSDLVADLQFLNDAVRNGHPANYRREPKIVLDSLILRFEKTLPDSITWRQYEAAVRESVSHIGCVHTSVKSSPIRQKEKAQEGFFPWSVFTDGSRIYAYETPKDTAGVPGTGDEIVSVNGMLSTEIISQMMQYRTADGKGETFMQQLINRNFASLYYFYFGQHPIFEITYLHKGHEYAGSYPGSGKTALQARDWKILPQEGEKIAVKSKTAHLSVLPGNIQYLRIGSFGKGYKLFYRRVFRYLGANPGQSLVIDLRDNLGGSRSNAEKLLSYLLPVKTSYSVIRPEQNLGPYLRGKEKMKFRASYFYYDVRELFHRKKLSDGVAFKYEIKPRRKASGNQPVYVLVNGYTASSSTIVASYLKHHRQAVVVGELTAGGEYRNNGGSYPNLVLPRSGITIHTSTYRMEYDFAREGDKGIVPDLPVIYDADSYQRKDLEMELIKGRIVQ